jgi:predicted RND superfamily exporter protein
VPSPPDRESLTRRYCRFIGRRARLVLAIATLVFAGSVAIASRLELRTAFSELLPSNDPGVVTMHKTSQRMGDLTLLLIGVRSPDRQATLRYAEMLTGKLRQLPPHVVSLATYHIRDVRDFFKHNQWLYVSEADLTTIRDRLRKEIGKRKNPLFMDLGGDDEPVDQLRARLTSRDPLGGRFPDGVLSDKDGKYVWIAALPPGGLFGERAGEKLHHAAEQLIRDNDPARHNPGMKAEVLGPVATLIANRQAVERDILWVTGTCIVVVALSILLFFRRWRVVPMIGVPAVIGTVMAFAAAQLLFGYVNSSTAFLGSIIVGNGINYAIILMSRYQEQRAAGDDLPLALERTIDGVLAATGVAALCASASYASLMLTSFRGFYQFGAMGAIGVLCCWIASFTVLPAMIIIGDRGAQGSRARIAPLSLAPLGRLLIRRPAAVLLTSVAVTVVSLFGLWHFTAQPFEYDFRRLNARITVSETTRQFDASQSSLFGRWPQPTIVLADSADEVEAVRAAIRRQDDALPGPDVIGQIVTVNDILPGTPQVQAQKLELLREILRLKQDALTLADDSEKQRLSQIDPSPDLRLLTPEDLPPLARRPFTEVAPNGQQEGPLGRVLLVYPVEEGISIWNGRDLLKIATVLQRLQLPQPGGSEKTLDTSGSAVIFASMIRSILRDGPIATGASLLAVVLLILLVMRPMRVAALAIATLLVGVVWMVGAAGLVQVKITFLNFIALPITFGIGAEYAINVVTRNRETRDIVRAVVSTGSAVALCSWTTIVGYGSLLAAQNRALQGFGAMAILGEVACLLAAVAALPSLVVWLQRRQQRQPGQFQGSSTGLP